MVVVHWILQVPPENIGLGIFVISAVFFSTPRSSCVAFLGKNKNLLGYRLNWDFPFRSIRSTKLIPSDETAEYSALLQRMFQPVKNPSRHLGLSEIFSHRQRFFYDLYKEMKLDVNILHVAGTKGKGSTCEFLSSSLTAAGYRVGVFTSPHLHTARERIKIGHSLISMTNLIKHGRNAVNRLENQNWAVFFDYFLAAAIMYFGEQSRIQKMDYIVLECGIGGRYDSTNFFPDVVDSTRHSCVITSISYDHQAILGDTLPDIAWQKAGIMRANCNVFTIDQQEPEVLETFRSEANKVNARLTVVPIDKLLLQNKGLKYEHHAQLQNCMLAEAVLSQWNVSTQQGRDTFYWPCRMETFLFNTSTLGISSSSPNSPTPSQSSSSLSSPRLDHEQMIVLDGCHNGDSINVFLNSLHEKYPNHQKLILFGAGMEKSIDSMMVELFRLADKIVFVQSQHFKSYSESQLLTKISSPESLVQRTLGSTISRKIVYLPKLESLQGGTISHRLLYCIRSVSQICNQQPTVIGVCGSLFAASDAREALFRLDSSLFSPGDWVRFADPPIFT